MNITINEGQNITSYDVIRSNRLPVIVMSWDDVMHQLLDQEVFAENINDINYLYYGGYITVNDEPWAIFDPIPEELSDYFLPVCMGPHGEICSMQEAVFYAGSIFNIVLSPSSDNVASLYYDGMYVPGFVFDVDNIDLESLQTCVPCLTVGGTINTAFGFNYTGDQDFYMDRNQNVLVQLSNNSVGIYIPDSRSSEPLSQQDLDQFVGMFTQMSMGFRLIGFSDDKIGIGDKV